GIPMTRNHGQQVAVNRVPSEILFISDVVEELDAAASTEMQTALSLRPGNKPVGVDCGHRKISSFALV
ncbi:MAG: hypothetical protein AAFN70_20385, partial [Planctomycetota bacterium]